MSEHNGSRIPPWFVKIVFAIGLVTLVGAAGAGLAWGTWVTQGIFKVEQMADDVREIKDFLLKGRQLGGKE